MRWSDAALLIACALMVAAVAFMVGAPVSPSACTTTIEKTNKERAPYG